MEIYGIVRAYNRYLPTSRSKPVHFQQILITFPSHERHTVHRGLFDICTSGARFQLLHNDTEFTIQSLYDKSAPLFPLITLNSIVEPNVYDATITTYEPIMPVHNIFWATK